MERQEAHTSPRKPADAVAPPAAELSPSRVAILLVVLAGLGFAGWQLVTRATPAADAKSGASPVYAPYVDVTQTPTYPFQLPSSNPVSSVFLAFVVSDPGRPCTPSWGSYYSLAGAARSLDLDARAAQVRKEGGSVMISFGGRDNTELAVACTDEQRLADAYRAPLERYHATVIDLDLEGAALDDPAANARRATAVASIQRELAARHTPLRVWLTLPVSQAGLTSQGVAAVRAMLRAHVRLAGVNAMAMNLGSATARGAMIRAIESALESTQAQVQALWRAAGLPSSAASAWSHVGVTVLLGVNGSADERFTTDDARALADFVTRHGIPRVSAWSLNRDFACGGAFPRTGIVSNTCSGVLQKPLQFTKIFARLRGTTRASSGAEASSPQQQSGTPAVDDPATSPYPIWRAAAAYDTGYKVVWRREIYEASWWTQGTPPDAAGAQSPTGPWQPIGPVPRGSRAPKLVLLVSGTLPPWSPSAVYHQGDRVDYAGLPYQARWYTKGDQPLANLPADPGTPWQPLFRYPGEPTAVSTGTEGHG